MLCVEPELPSLILWTPHFTVTASGVCPTVLSSTKIRLPGVVPSVLTRPMPSGTLVGAGAGLGATPPALALAKPALSAVGPACELAEAALPVGLTAAVPAGVGFSLALVVDAAVTGGLLAVGVLLAVDAVAPPLVLDVPVAEPPRLPGALTG